MGKQRRNRPGIRHEDWSSWDSVPLDKLDSTFAIQEYLQSVLRINPAALALFCPSPENQDADLWRYELLRQTCLELNGLVIALESDCTAETCPQMKALDWLYLCAGHVQPQQCTALDYTVHTLDAAIAQLNNQKSFPSRVSIPRNSLKHLTSITRRLYRIFAHAWFHHREIFIEFEAESHLYARFLHMIKTYNIMADDAIIIPLQACQTEVPGLTPTIISPTDVVLAEMTELDTPKPQPLSLISADVHQDDTSHDPRNEQIHAPVTPARPTSLFPVPKVSPDQITAPLSATHDDDSYKPMEDADLGPSVTSLDDDMDGQEAANLTIAVLDDVVDDDPAADRSDSHSGDLLQSDNKPGGDVLPKTCSEESDVQSDIGDTAAYSSSPPKEGQEPKPPSSQKPNSPTKSTGVSDRDPISSGTSPGKKKKKRKGGGSMRGKDSSPQRL